MLNYYRVTLIFKILQTFVFVTFRWGGSLAQELDAGLVGVLAASLKASWGLWFQQVGDEGAGHFVKMVHNGIEYGDMQLICEAYHLMKDVLGMEHDEMAKVSPRPFPGHRGQLLLPRGIC